MGDMSWGGAVDGLVEQNAKLLLDLKESRKLAQYRLEEIKRLMLKDPHDKIVTVYGVPLDHYAEFIMAIESRSVEKADRVLAELYELRNKK